ncbi:MAG TPA: lyase family protein [bacterium]|nr:lyase family protein [bacterium]HPT29710.1 lyase family protein [bacterium]
MVSRYAHPEIEKIFSDEHKLELWQKTELSLIKARLQTDVALDAYVYEAIYDACKLNPIDVEWWKKRDEEIHHDLNAFLDERLRFIPQEHHQWFHKNITSYDTEEPAFARSLSEAAEVICKLSLALMASLQELAVKYRYTIMNGRTHGQEAEMQSFGAKCLTWLADYQVANEAFFGSLKNLRYSKLSGAIGKYGSLDPKLEMIALEDLGFIPFFGSTQIMPRVLYAPVTQSLTNMLEVAAKIGLDIRLASRSGQNLLHEPFKKKQKGSSAMPHKKNTIRTEQLEGLARLSEGYMLAITRNIVTWEERAIEQSCVERVAWPDIFHVAAQSLKVLHGVLSGLKVYPDNMLQEIHQSRGVYASSEVKEFLKTELAGYGLAYEDIYRIVQLACFNVFSPSPKKMAVRNCIPTSFDQAMIILNDVCENLHPEKVISIEDFIPMGKLRPTDDLDISSEQIDEYNQALKHLFSDQKILLLWHRLFTPEFLLRNESVLYERILGVH